MSNTTNLLVIDDDPALLTGLKAILGREGYSVSTTCHGTNGITLARESTPDLILCDLMMPPPNGFDVLHTLSRDPQTAHIPFIFLTARASEIDKVRGLRSGADDYIVKPFSREELLARIEAVLRRSRRNTLTVEPEAQE